MKKTLCVRPAHSNRTVSARSSDRLMQMLAGVVLALSAVAIAGCSGTRDQDAVDRQRDTMSHGGTENMD